MVSPKAIGIIGFGEAGRAFADGLQKNSHQILVYDSKPLSRVPPDIEVVGTLEELAESVSLLLCCIWPGAAAQVAENTALHLNDSHVYCDLNNISPQTTISIQKTVEEAGASFVKGAVMSPIAEKGALVPILLGGTQAQTMAEEFQELGLCVEFSSTEPQVPAAIKILRSILLKGIVALAFETYWAGEKYGAGRQILESGFKALSENALDQTVENWMNTTLVHAQRRAQELGEAALTVEEAGFEPIMSKAAQKLLEEVAERVAARHQALSTFTEL